MRATTLIGLSAVWLGSVYLVGTLATGEFAATLGYLSNLFLGVVFLVVGGSFLLGGQEIPEDTGEQIVPTRWAWYAITGALVISATFRTAELLGFVTV